ncbi:MAG: hypothetical protein Q4B71_03245 [Cardiobacteriaceae bacterium]|nr:hypothetical protein [Cardiobacteriaceae bacterium]
MLAIPTPFLLLQLAAIDKPLIQKLAWLFLSSGLILLPSLFWVDHFSLKKAMIILVALFFLTAMAHAFFHGIGKDKGNPKS